MNRTSPSRLECPACGCKPVRIFYEATGVPVNSVLLLGTRKEAIEFPTGDIRLGFCANCGFIYNTAFDPKLVEYSSRYEETQGFSPLFNAWHQDLARRLVDRYSLRNKKIVEIGCGKGEFLSMLCEMGNNTGIGFDPSYLPERNDSPAASKVEFVRDYYTEKDLGHRGDFVCCKMTLEHIIDTGKFAGMVRRSLDDAPATDVFFQVPDVLRILEEQAFWDVYYEHCSYFSIGSLARLFRKAGFRVTGLSREYDDQYITVESRPNLNGTSAPLPEEEDLGQLKHLVDKFSRGIPERIGYWNQRLEQCRQEQGKAVIWGAGSKGVTFLATLNIADTIEYAVDINPNKHGYYMATTGLEIVAPEFLIEYRPRLVIVMNPIYRDEIAAQLDRMGVGAEVVTT